MRVDADHRDFTEEREDATVNHHRRRASPRNTRNFLLNLLSSNDYQIILYLAELEELFRTR